MSMMDMGGGLPPATAAAPPTVEPAPMPPTAGPGLQNLTIKREPGDVGEAEKALVTDLCKWARETRGFRSKTYSKMRRDMKFVRPGRQWPSRAPENQSENDSLLLDDRYEANLTQRHVQQRVAALYAKNPTIVAKRRKRMDFTIWDGDQSSLLRAIQSATGSPGDPGDPAKGIPPMPPVLPNPTPEDQALLQDVAQGMNRRKMIDRVSKTLEILYSYFMEEGNPVFKTQAKQLIRRVMTCGCAFVQIGFQRVMGPNTEILNEIRDDQERIKYLETLTADLHDQKFEEYSKEMEELKTGLQTLQGQTQIVLREGLVFDFPRSTDIIVDRECTQLKGFLGAKRVAREYHYSKMKVKELFQIDLATTYTQYEPSKSWQPSDRTLASNNACVWAIWDANTKQVYYVCDGYPAFLKTPAAPEVDVEGFFPFKTLSFNDVEDESEIYPPSDVELMRSMQLEYNRSREGLREHRIANKPGYVVAKGLLDEVSKKALQDHDPNEIVELNLGADQIKEIKNYIAARPTMPIDPTVYDTEYLYQDILRVLGEQQANFGATSGSTATEASIAETSRVSSLQSSIDDLNDFLSALSRDGGSILLAEMSKDKVVEICGPGAVWPELSREDIAKEIYLEIEAGSSGRPNKALEISNWERLMPFFVQMKGIKPDWLLRQSMLRLEDPAEIEDAFDIQLPSIVAQNAIDSGKGSQLQPSTGNPATDPNQQGDVGRPGPEAGVNPHQPGPKPNYPVLTGG